MELQLQGIQKQQEELTALIEELKKTKAQDVVFSTLEGEDNKGEYTDPIPSPDHTTSLNYELRTELETKADLS